MQWSWHGASHKLCRLLPLLFCEFLGRLGCNGGFLRLGPALCDLDLLSLHLGKKKQISAARLRASKGEHALESAMAQSNMHLNILGRFGPTFLSFVESSADGR